MGKRKLEICLLFGIILSFALSQAAQATGTGTQTDPFIVPSVDEMHLNARIMVQGNTLRLNINGNDVISQHGYDVHGNAFSADVPVNQGKNTISIYSDFDDNMCSSRSPVPTCDQCGISDIYRNHVVATFWIGSNPGNNMMWTQSTGQEWTSTTKTGGVAAIGQQYSGEQCAFGGTYYRSTFYVPSDLPDDFSDKAKCLYTVVDPTDNSGEPTTPNRCDYINLSRTFYVQLSECSYTGPGQICGYKPCPPDSHYIDSGSCYIQNYSDSCTKICSPIGTCQDCTCGSILTQVPWSCPTCQQKNLSSCTGPAGPSCEPSPTTTSCGTQSCSSNNHYFQDSGKNCYYRSYYDCTKYCIGNGSCGGCACNLFSSMPKSWPACGTCQQIDYDSCTGSAGPYCENSPAGTLCGSGSCDSYGGCISAPNLAVSAGFTMAFHANLSLFKGETVEMKSNVSCSKADCGYVYVSAKSTAGTPIDQISGLKANCEPTNCQQICGVMGIGLSCYPNWSITALETGVYNLVVTASSSGSGLAASSPAVTLSVSEPPAGSLSAGISLSSSAVIVGENLTARCEISCTGDKMATCGNITSTLKLNSADMKGPGSQDVFTYSGNPRLPASCMNMMEGQSCSLTWIIGTQGKGTFYLSCEAQSDNSKVAVFKTPQAILDVMERPIGIIRIYNPSLSQSPIASGSTVKMAADIKCETSPGSTASCGRVRLYPRQSGNILGRSGSLTVISSERDCGIMSTSSPACNVNWTITANSQGNYSLDILADSDLPEIDNATSQGLHLKVSSNAGALSVVRFEASPGEINLNQTTTVSATLNCSSSYCGAVNVYLKTNEMLLTPTSSPLSAVVNQQSCTSFPCNLYWSVTGSSEAAFPITLEASSSESMPVNRTISILVKGQNSILSITLLMPSRISLPLGQTLNLAPNATCFVKDCGQATLSLYYKKLGTWKLVDSSEDVYLARVASNPVVMNNMKAGQMIMMPLELGFKFPGEYELGIFANGSAPGTANEMRTVTVNVAQTGELDIEVLSPVPEESVFLMGDVINLKARITRGGLPARNLSPITATIPDLIMANLFDDGSHGDNQPDDGIYAGTAVVPSKAKLMTDQYRLLFTADNANEPIYIKIDPTLQVSIGTDKSSYVHGEKIRLFGEVMKKGAAAPASMILDAIISTRNWSGRARFNATGSYSYLYDSGYIPNVDGSMKITVTAYDEFLNTGSSSAEVQMLKETGNYYPLVFVMDKYNYSRGETIHIKVEIPGILAEDMVNVRCLIAGEEIQLEKAKTGYFSRDFTIPASNNLGEETLSCLAKGKKTGESHVGINVEPMPLKVSIISPSTYQNILPVVSEKAVELKIYVRYPDERPVTDGHVQILLGDEVQNMSYTGVPGIYTDTTIFKKTVSGTALISMVFQATDSQGNFGETNVTLAVDTGEFNWWWLLLIPAGVGVFFVAWNLYARSKPQKIQIQEKIIRIPVRERVREVVYKPIRLPERKPDPAARLIGELEKLQEKERTVLEAKDLAEQQYYKRQIDEATFSKLMLSYEEKLIELSAAIKQKRKDLYELGIV